MTDPGSAEGPIITFSGRYRFLSSTYPCRFTLAGVIWPSAEHAFHALKSRDGEERLKLSRIRDWREVKAAGRALACRPDWPQVRKRAMFEAHLAKYSQHPEMLGWLIATGERALTEGNGWHDNIWGDCHCANQDGRHPECLQPGWNYLGHVLMSVRFLLRPDGWR